MTAAAKIEPYANGARLKKYGGHEEGRFMVPSSPNRAYRWLKDGRDILHMVLRAGDRCPDDRYDLSKERAYLVFDVARSSSRPAHTPMRMDTFLDLWPGVPVSSWWFSFMQWNQRPGADGLWRPPPFSLDVTVVEGREYLVARVRHLDEAGHVKAKDVATMPFERRRYKIAAQFTCSNGLPSGRCRLTVDDAVIGEYEGPTGYPGRDTYAAVGLYRAAPRNLKDEQHVMFEGFREGIDPAGA